MPQLLSTLRLSGHHTVMKSALIKDDAELFKQFMDNDSFKRWMTETVFTLACKQAS